MIRGTAALALLAALTVFFQPVCAAFEFRAAAPHSPAVTLVDDAAHGTSDFVACCPEVVPTALVAPSAAGIAKAAIAAQAVVSLAYAIAPRAALSSHARPAAIDPPPLLLLSYYARSARILR